MKLNPGSMTLQINHKNTSLFHKKENLYSEELYSKTYKQSISALDFKNESNEINSLGYRCDEFKNNHNDLHILFSGCSVTWGSGLVKDELWSTKLYNKIKEKNNCSGYFNLSFPGTGVSHQVFDMFKYFNLYGNPDYIFYNFPPLSRFYYYNTDFNEIGDAFFNFKDIASYELFKLLNYQYYLMLHQYCKSNNIGLYSFTWSTYEKNSQALEESKINSFDSFYSINEKEITDFIFEHKQKNNKDKYSLLARDKDHPGTAYHEYWAEFIYNNYEKDGNDK